MRHPFIWAICEVWWQLTEMGAIVAPPIPAFYQKPQNVIDLVDHSVERVLDLLGLPSAGAKRWDDVSDDEEA